jgi:hypothetical protein
MGPPSTGSEPTRRRCRSPSDRLRRHHAEGRLDTEELQERIDRRSQANTVGELERLITDLPPSRPPTGDFISAATIAATTVISVSGWRHGPWGMSRRGDTA